MGDHASDARRRKVRKGTHSCWECRRRKIRCQFGPGDDVVCLPCQARGSTCRSQEFVDDARPQQPDKRLAQRLGRLEDLMTKLVDRMVPDAAAKARPRTQRVSLSPSTGRSQGEDDDNGNAGYRDRLDALEASMTEESPVGLLLGLRQGAPPSAQPLSIPTPESSSAATYVTPRSLHDADLSSGIDSTRRTLHALFPAPSDIFALTSASAAPYFLISLFCSFRDIIEGKAENSDMVSVIPPVESHPAVLAKRLLQIIICLQQLPPGFDLQMMEMKTSGEEVMANVIAAVSRLVTSNDEFLSTSEGLQCLVLQGYWHANAGNLRKAWMSHRKALSLAQLMGLDRGCARTLKSVDPTVPDRQKPTPYGLWCRINICDRFSSLLLGLPVGSTDNHYASDEATKRDTDMERMEKSQSVIAARIVQRNANKTGEAYAMTQAINRDLKALAAKMDDEWWQEPLLDPFEGKEHNLGLMYRLFRQVQHYDLMVLLHLPYMLRNPAERVYNDSKATCVDSSRAVLQRFVSFRTLYNSAWSCRHIDYSALVSAMTLLLSYLRQDKSQPIPPCAERASDRKLVEVVRARMQHIAVVNRDKLSEESANIVGQMMSILNSIDQSTTNGLSESSTEALRCLHFDIPYFGTVDIHPTLSTAVKGACDANVDDQSHSSNLQDFNTVDFQQLQPAMANLSTTTSSGLTPTFAQDPIQLDFGTVDPALLPTDMSMAGMFMQFDFQPRDGVLELPLTADANDWVFQGVDTTYWSLLNEGSLMPQG
ncbi:transcription factor sdnS [Podospora aff. communis PSN243]|uniref:Transcription factor sdnS n=1 Tax=Podospora aff. communis PSN243 TaxID=3040156 RepID=A0AAV9G0I1_9PEZI|nr:transcription factor sdnS [Podospora aff. communis PSN243]